MSSDPSHDACDNLFERESAARKNRGQNISQRSTTATISHPGQEAGTVEVILPASYFPPFQIRAHEYLPFDVLGAVGVITTLFRRRTSNSEFVKRPIEFQLQERTY